MNFSPMTVELIPLILTLFSTSKCQLPWRLSLLWLCWVRIFMAAIK